MDLTAYGKGTFKTFCINDGTTLPLYYQLAPNAMLVPHDTLDAEFLSLAEAEGIADIEELNKILERAVNLKNFLKGKPRIEQVARYVLRHYLDNVEPLGYKAFLVAVDREACALYKQALDAIFTELGLPTNTAQVVFTDNNNDTALLKQYHLDAKQERQIRKSFCKLEQQPKILIVTEKLLAELSRNEERKKQQAENGIDALTFFINTALLEANINNPDAVSQQIKAAFVNHPNWKSSEAAWRELRNQVTFALYAECDQPDQVTPLVESLFTTLAKGDRPG